MSKKIEIHGHRGARGLLPENTLSAFTEAVRLGVDAIELDVVISKDNQVVVSHEEWMHELFCTQPNGLPIQPNTETQFNLYEMPYANIKLFDCGTKQNSHFPEQKTVKSYKPLLSEVIEHIEEYIKTNQQKPITYNIEIKSEVAHYDIFQPQPERLVELILNVLKPFQLNHRIMLQCFDINVLQILHQLTTNIPLGLLIENNNTPAFNLNLLGFKPHFYNPEFILVNKELIQQLHQQQINIIPWTVNDINDMEQLVKIGVDGIITDYPNRAIELLRNNK